MSVIGGAVAPSADVKIVKILDPRLQVNDKRELGVVKGVSQALWKHEVANSLSNSSISWNINIADRLVIYRAMFVKMSASFAWTGTTTSGVLITPKYDALRAFPLQSVTNAANLQLNNNSSSINPADYIAALGHYMDPKDALNYGSGAPCYLDQFQDYSATGDSVRNQFGLWGNSHEANLPQRGAFTPTYTSDATTGSVTVTWYEPLIALSPLLFGKSADDQPGLANVSNLQLTLNLGDLSRMWSHDNTRGGGASNVSVITATTVTINSAELLLCTLTPDPVFNNIQMDHSYLYSYYQLQNYTNNLGALAAAASTSASSNTISVESVPSRIYVFVNRQKADRSVTTTDTFARINSISITWNGRSGILAGTDVHDLFRMSSKNGLKVPYLGFSNYQGSVVAIDPAGDVGLHSDEAVGSLERQQFQVTVNYTNTSAASVNYQLNVLVSAPGSMAIRSDAAMLNVGLLTKADVLASEISPNVRYRDYADADNVFGGSWWDVIKDAGKSVYNAGKDAVNVGRDVVDFGKKNIGNATMAASFLAPELLPALAVANQYLGKGRMGGARMRRVRGGCGDCVSNMSANQLERRMNA